MLAVGAQHQEVRIVFFALGMRSTLSGLRALVSHVLMQSLAPEMPSFCTEHI